MTNCQICGIDIAPRHRYCQACLAKVQKIQADFHKHDQQHVNRTCQNCGAPFIGSNHRKYCLECMFAAKVRRTMRAGLKPLWLEIIQKAPACAKCGKLVGFENLTMDHIMPVSRGGKTELENLQPLCRRCNSSKGDCLPVPSSAASHTNPTGAEATTQGQGQQGNSQ